METSINLLESRKFREFQLPPKVGFGVRTIQRRILTGEFPKPDYYEEKGKKKWGVWLGSTIENYLRRKMGL